MPSPFPGVDPYLENPELWPEVHDRLITAIAIAIAPSIRPKYRVTLLNQVYDQAGFDLAVDYKQPSVPSLNGEDATWAEVLLRESGLGE